LVDPGRLCSVGNPPSVPWPRQGRIAVLEPTVCSLAQAREDRSVGAHRLFLGPGKGGSRERLWSPASPVGRLRVCWACLLEGPQRQRYSLVKGRRVMAPCMAGSRSRAPAQRGCRNAALPARVASPQQARRQERRGRAHGQARASARGAGQSQQIHPASQFMHYCSHGLVPMGRKGGAGSCNTGAQGRIRRRHQHRCTVRHTPRAQTRQASRPACCHAASVRQWVGASRPVTR
jgi:hypothetical protein